MDDDLNPSSEFNLIQDPRGANFECKECEETDEVKVTMWKNGLAVECGRCGFEQLFRAEKPKSIYEDGDDE